MSAPPPAMTTNASRVPPNPFAQRQCSQSAATPVKEEATRSPTNPAVASTTSNSNVPRNPFSARKTVDMITVESSPVTPSNNIFDFFSPSVVSGQRHPPQSEPKSESAPLQESPGDVDSSRQPSSHFYGFSSGNMSPAVAAESRSDDQPHGESEKETDEERQYQQEEAEERRREREEKAARHSNGIRGAQILEFLFLGSVNDAQNETFLAENNIRTIVNLSQERYWLKDPSTRVFFFDVSDAADFPIQTIFRQVFRIIDHARKEWVEATYGKMKNGKTEVDDEEATVRREDDPEDSGHDDEEESKLLLPQGTSPSETTASGAPDAGAAPRALSKSNKGPGAVLVHCQKGISRSATLVVAYLMRRNGWSPSEALEFVRRHRPIANPNLGFLNILNRFYDTMVADATEPLKRARMKLCLICRNVTVNNEDVERWMSDFGQIWKLERREAICMVFFCTCESRRWAMLAAHGDETHCLTGGQGKLLFVVPPKPKPATT